MIIFENENNGYVLPTYENRQKENEIREIKKESPISLQ
jgi:hypothetical protein